ncbi:MAG: penicillin-binding transpeptidase domain-containing protein, partial [Oscillospiraceae bacterium]
NDIGRRVRMIEDFKRYYPYGSMGSVVLGFTGTDNTGLLGVELEYEKELSGTKGRMVSSKNAIGTDMPFQYEQLITAENGYNLVLTIDETVQSIVEKYLEEGAVKYGVKNGSTAVVMEVKTGNILALAVSDNFDLNDPFTIANPKVQEELDKLPADQQDAAYSDALQKQWRNKAVSDGYYPGSVFKMVTASMALDSGKLSLTDTFDCGGSYHVGDRDIGCWYSSGHGTLDVRGGICNSCNPFFMQTGERIGAHDFFKYFEAFGLTSRTGIDLPGEADSIYFDEENLTEVNLAAESFGQNFNITPLQMITAAAAISNGGYIMQPHVVDRILDSEGNIVKKIDPVYKRQVISKEISKEVISILNENATTGSGKNGNVPGYRICGKTGTSEKIEQHAQNPEKPMEYIASFCGFAPAEDPQYALLVYFDEPDRNTASGGFQAAPVFAAIMKEILPYLGVEAQLSSAEYTERQVNAPNVIGKTIAQATSILEETGLSAKVFGDKQADEDVVLSQIPSAGAAMPKDGSVVICTAETIKDSELITAPDFTDKGEAECENMAAELGLQVVFTGAATDGDLRAQNQNIPAGEKVKPGTVITITLVDLSGIERTG